MVSGVNVDEDRSALLLLGEMPILVCSALNAPCEIYGDIVKVWLREFLTQAEALSLLCKILSFFLLVIGVVSVRIAFQSGD